MLTTSYKPEYMPRATFPFRLAWSRLRPRKAVIAGPDINPTVFIAEAALIVSNHLCPDAFDGYGELIGSGSSSSSSSESSSDAGEAAVCDAAPLIATTLMSMCIATLLVGLAFFALGKFNLTGIVGFIPANVVAGFLSCIGYKVLKASVEAGVRDAGRSRSSFPSWSSA